jgi:predicted TIM-barrel fold metal-dependent hydrolase
MVKLINVHCHLLNYQFISPECFRSLSVVLAAFVRHRRTRPIIRLASALMPRRRFHRFYEMYDLMELTISEVADQLRNEMDLAGIQFAVPLVMDMGRAAYAQNPKVPFTFQMKVVSDLSLKHFGYMMPFLMVDPRRTRASDLLIRGLDQLGYLGAKMYPSLGYHPDPDSFLNDPQTNDELHKIYSYCESNSVPMTAHCSPGGAYSDDILRIKEIRSELTQPSAWSGVLKKYPRLQLDLAHFGQDLIHNNDPNSWSACIKGMMHEYPGVYTDLAYNKDALMDKTSRQYFDALNKLLDGDSLVRDRILFGTDWAMTRHTWREVDYVAPFRKWLDDRKLQKIAFENSLNFLFPGRTFPERIQRFLVANGKSYSELPKWLTSSIACEKVAV